MTDARLLRQLTFALMVATRFDKDKGMSRALLIFCVVLFPVCFPDCARAAQTNSNAQLTQIIHEVSLLLPDGPPRRATLNEIVPETNAVKTGSDSRAELTFPNLTITRLGANTLYRFKNAGRRVDLDSGSTLIRVPKNSGGASVLTSSITAGSAGTTFIFEYARNGSARLIVLEGSARLTLVKQGNQTRTIGAGEMLEVPPGAVRIPGPKQVDLAQLMRTSPLIVGFRPLPSLDLINNSIRQQQQRGQLNQPNNRNGPPSPQNQPGPAAPPGPGPR